MSRQINFFIIPEDWPQISDFLSQAGANFIKVPVLKIDHIFIGSINEDLKASQSYLTRGNPGKNLVLNPSKAGYYLDIEQSDAIEFNRGGFFPNSDKILHRARFYTVFKYYDDNGHLISKDPDFSDWVEDIYKSFQRTFSRKTDTIKIFVSLKKQRNGCERIMPMLTRLA